MKEKLCYKRIHLGSLELQAGNLHPHRTGRLDDRRPRSDLDAVSVDIQFNQVRNPLFATLGLPPQMACPQNACRAPSGNFDEKFLDGGQFGILTLQ